MKRNMLWAGLAALLFLSATSFGQDTFHKIDIDGDRTVDINGDTQGDFEMILGVTPTKVTQVNMDTARQMVTGVNNRLSQFRMECPAPANGPTANRIWAGVLGQWEKAKNLGTPRTIEVETGKYKTYDITGYKYNSWGLMLGYDRQFGPVTVGASFGFSKGNYKDLAMVSNNSKIENYSLNVYGLYTNTTGFWASGMFGWTHARNKMDYRVGNDDLGHFKEKYQTNSLYIEGKVGYDWRVNQFRLSPSIGLGYIHSRSKAHNVEMVKKAGEEVEGGLRYNKHTGKTGYLPIMLEAAYDAQLSNGVLSASVNGGYTHNFSKKGADGTITSIDADTKGTITWSSFAREKGRGIWNIGAGLKYDTGRWEGGVKYDYYSKKKAHANRIYGWIGIKF